MRGNRMFCTSRTAQRDGKCGRIFDLIVCEVMRRFYLIVSMALIPCLAVLAWLKWLEADSANTLLDVLGRIRPHSTLAEVAETLGPADYTLKAPEFPPWLEKSAIGNVKQGTVLVYLIKKLRPKLLIIHLLPGSGVQFVTWVPT